MSARHRGQWSLPASLLLSTLALTGSGCARATSSASIPITGFTAANPYVMVVSGGSSTTPLSLAFDWNSGAAALVSLSPAVGPGAGWISTPQKRGQPMALPPTYYATGNPRGGNGSVAAFAMDPSTGVLGPLGFPQSSGGNGPAHTSVHPSGTALLTSNYGSGHIAVLPINADRSLGAPSQVLLAGANAHEIVSDPTGAFVFVPCLGVDYVAQYVVTGGGGGGALTLSPNPGGAVAPLSVGAGPRHMVFHPSLRFAFVICELASLMATLKYDAGAGLLSAPTYVSTLPSDVTPVGQGAGAIAISSDGAFVYGSNRGVSYWSVAVFAVNAATGGLSLVSFAGERDPAIYWPRFMVLTADAGSAWLLVAGERGNAVAAFRRDAATGGLTKAGNWSTSALGLVGPQWVGVYATYATATSGAPGLTMALRIAPLFAAMVLAVLATLVGGVLRS